VLPSERIRAITANYFYWQGLRLVPFGLAGLVWAATWTDRWPAAVSVEVAVLATLVLAVAAFWLIGRYYDRTLGQVIGDPATHRVRSRLVWFVAYPLLGASLVFDALLAPPLFISGIVWAIGILGYWWSTGQGRPHYLVLAPLTASLTFLPLLGLVHPGRDMLPPFFAWLGLVYIVAGLLDHRDLVRALPPASAR
jgi:hypothetical protein